ncbi:MAG: hypothetical protein CBE11_00905 [Rickettsiales bacterium TMED251]|nr:MAG: hypothetical protein CBE11_00905 [Rickettsiales bacterium TMED251]|tara:strand:+ start:56 stop:490 length:435 start_codon:yes stop_codon:yes gene_type:complete
MRIIILFYILFNLELIAKDYVFKAYATSDLNTIDISENEKFSSYTSNGLWDDSDGDYGSEKCSGFVRQSFDEVDLQVYCETVNQNGDIFWNSRIRKSIKGAGAGQMTILNGTGKYRKYIGLICPYGILYKKKDAWFKAKCKFEN